VRAGGGGEGVRREGRGCVRKEVGGGGTRPEGGGKRVWWRQGALRAWEGGVGGGC